jgi:hypothetical protein
MEKRVIKKITRMNLRQEMDKLWKKEDWELYASDRELMREVRFLPKGLVFNSLIQIYENKIAVIVPDDENYAFILESKELSAFMKNIFLLLWHMAK